jgi:hypothetical protein
MKKYKIPPKDASRGKMLRRGLGIYESILKRIEKQHKKTPFFSMNALINTLLDEACTAREKRS